VVVRNTARAVEIFCVERHQNSAFMGGAVVFPGGKVDPSDHAEVWRDRSTPLADRPRRLARAEATARAFAVAALREALEEAALLPVVGDSLDAQRTMELRASVTREHRPARAALASALSEQGLVLDTARLEAVARWITPKAEPRRFDTRFYLLALPPGQTGLHDDHETTRSFWATPDELLERWRRGEISLAPPTSWTISLFQGISDVEGAFAVARRQDLAPVEPCLVRDRDETILTLPGDPLHPTPGPPPVEPGAPSRFVFEGGRFEPRRVG
jgi:8-oxo-dGTP pyrophosphatase MutT (NUDIX family)